MMLLFFVDVDEIWTQVSSWSCCKIFKLNIGQYWTSCFGTCRLVKCTLTMAPSWDLSYHNWIGCIAFSWTPKWATNPIRPQAVWPVQNHMMQTPPTWNLLLTLSLRFAQAFWDCQFYFEISFQQFTWQRLVQKHAYFLHLFLAVQDSSIGGLVTH